MTRYLISFPGDAMDHIPDEDGPEVARAAHAVIDEAKDAGVYLFAGGLDEGVEPVMVAGDGTVTVGTYPQTKELGGGVTIIDVPTGGCPRVGRKDRGRLPLCARGPGIHVRPARLIEAPMADKALPRPALQITARS